MHQSRLFELLRTFSPQERLRLRLFVASPYFSRGEQAGQLIALLDFCLNSLDSEAEPESEKTEAYAALFPGEAPVAGKLEKRMSALHGLALQFLVAEHCFLPENELDRQVVLAQSFQKRGLTARARSALKAARHMLEHAAQHDSGYFAKKLKLTEQEANYAILMPSRSVKVPFDQYFETLFLFYHTVKQELALALKALSSRYAFQPSALTQRIMNEAPLPPEFLKQNPILYLSSLYVALMNRAEPDMDDFNRFVHDLREQEHLLAPNDVQNCWASVRNLLIQWWNKNRSRELAQLYLDISLENAARGVLYYDGKILPYVLEPTCKLALELGQFDLAHKFVLEHRGKISGEPDDEPFFRYNLARYYLYTGALEKALEELPHSIPDISVQLNVKIMEIQILHELDSELLPYRMDALRMLLGRAGPRMNPPERLTAIRLFLNFLARIRRCPLGNLRRAEKIVADIHSSLRVTEYHWLLKQAAARALRK